jgi:hypothetical protein
MAQRRPRSLGFSLNNAWAGGSWELQRGAAQYTWNAIFTARNSSSTSVIAASTASMGVLCLLVCTWPGHEPPGYHPSVSDGVRQSSWPRRHRLAVPCRLPRAGCRAYLDPNPWIEWMWISIPREDYIRVSMQLPAQPVPHPAINT